MQLIIVTNHHSIESMLLPFLWPCGTQHSIGAFLRFRMLGSAGVLFCRGMAKVAHLMMPRGFFSFDFNCYAARSGTTASESYGWGSAGFM